jgi:50S ribosome-binding GTPase
MSARPPGPWPPEIPKPPPSDRDLPAWASATGAHIGRCLDRLDEVMSFAAALGVPVEGAASVRDDVLARMGFPADVYTLAFVGGTGVGKSSLLNALAGESVSATSVRRPTTDSPVAWVPGSARSQLAGLLAHLEVREVREHADEGLGQVAILDLPDMDSVEPAHRERVEALLPRVDAVVWVTDLEKYHDAVLHDAFLHRWIDHLDRQLVVLNKADRLTVDDAERVRRDLQLDMDRLAGGDGTGPGVIITSAIREGSLGPGVGAVRRWLAEGVDAKAVVRSRLAASLVNTIESLAIVTGVDPGSEVKPLLDADARARAADQATASVLRVVDMAGAESQAVAATRARARSTGGGPLGRVSSGVYRLIGREAREADPGAFLARWRERGSLSPAVDAITEAVTEPIRRAPDAVRPALLAVVDPERLEVGLAAATDRAIAEHGPEVPTSRVWPLLGSVQSAVTAVLGLAAAWLVLWIVIRFQVNEIAVPVLGQLPMPLVILLLALLAGLLVGRLLAFHAGWLGRRWARRLASDLRHAIGLEVADTAFASLDWVESVQRGVWTAARAAREECGERRRS